MVSKVLAAVLAAAVLSVGGYTYWQHSDGGCCFATKTPTTPAATNAPSDSALPPCCQEPSRASRVTVPTSEACCGDDIPAAPRAPEVVTIMPHEVK